MIAFEKQPNIENKIAVPTLAESERKAIEQALVKCKEVLGGKKSAARLLDVPRSTLQYRMNKYNLNLAPKTKYFFDSLINCPFMDQSSCRSLVIRDLKKDLPAAHPRFDRILLDRNQQLFRITGRSNEKRTIANRICKQ
jgi:hypothetical protein